MARATCDTTALRAFVAAAAEEVRMPGVAVGVWTGGHEAYACHGVTSLENPVPVDRDTAFLLGSVTETYTATALMCLVADGQVQLTAPVRDYLPELRLADERATAEITVLHLLNHTSGLDWGLIADTGEGDDALARYVSRLGELEQVAPPGTRAVLQPGGLQHGRADPGEGHGDELRAGHRLAAVRAAGAGPQLLRPRRHHDPAVLRGAQPRPGRPDARRPAVAAGARR